MILVELEVAGGCLNRLSVKGHDIREGESIPCGIASAFARTAARFFEQENGIQWSGDAPEPGTLWLNIKKIPDREADRIRGVSEYILKGFRDLEKDYPEIVQLKVIIK